MMMNVLFVLHERISSNSGVHVHDYANRLTGMGFGCAVAVPSGKDQVAALGTANYCIFSFDEILDLECLFPNETGPDIVHAWTPRENVRAFCDRLRKRYAFRQIIHLEDNEEYLCESFTGRPHKQLRRMSLAELDALIPERAYHPVRGREFLNSVDGVTVIVERLSEFITEGTPWLVLWPSADETLFFARSVNWGLRHRLSLPDEAVVLAYSGNVTVANAKDVRSLYLAVALLNREGVPTMLIRAGVDHCQFLGEDDSWSRAFVKHLGWVDHKSLPDVLAAADVFVQPGSPDRFNDYRFPSKIPEFFAIGRPVILPATNVGLQARHLIDAYVLSKADGIGIAEAVKAVVRDKQLYTRLCNGALNFSRTHMDGATSTCKLAGFYANLLGKSQ